MSRKRRTPKDEKYLVVRSSAAGVPDGFQIHQHQHAWHQLIFATAGVMTVRTPRGHWVVPPQSAVWVPAGLVHSIRFGGASALRTLYLRPGWSRGAPPACTAIAVSPLLRELVLRAVELGSLDRRAAAERAMALLVLEELRTLEAPPLDLPSPRSGPLLALAAALERPAARALTTRALARRIGLSTRTLERRFLAETGMTFFQWRRHRLMLRALERILLGEPLKAAADRAGYRGLSAFVAAFRATFGTSPGRYVAGLLR